MGGMVDMRRELCKGFEITQQGFASSYLCQIILAEI